MCQEERERERGTCLEPWYHVDAFESQWIKLDNGSYISMYFSDALVIHAHVKSPHLEPFSLQARNPQVSKLEFHSPGYFCSYEKS